jgi:hypothetical protein
VHYKKESLNSELQIFFKNIFIKNSSVQKRATHENKSSLRSEGVKLFTLLKAKTKIKTQTKKL